MKSFYLETFGCTQNKSDSEAVKALLEGNGFTQAGQEKADLVLINSCGVKDHTEAKILTLLKKLSAMKKNTARLVVFGCLSIISPERIKEIDCNILLFGPKPLNELKKFLSLKHEALSSPESRGLVKIISLGEGCLGNCSFCATKQARGQLKSRPEKEIIDEFRLAAGQGFQEFWLTSQDTGCYGLDIGSNLFRLMKKILLIEGNYKIRLGMMNYNHVKSKRKDFIKLFSSPKVFQFLHLPLQSGSNQVLQSMNRGHKAEDFLYFVQSLRHELPLLSLSTDIIVGFPAETEKDFMQTVKAVKIMQPDIINASKFSERPNIPALKLKPAVPGWKRKQRSAKLALLANRIALQRNNLLQGTEQKIFVSEAGKKGFVGRTFNYKHAVIKENLLGKRAEVKITQAFPTYLACSLLKR